MNDEAAAASPNVARSVRPRSDLAPPGTTGQQCSQIEILLNEPGPVISPDLYGYLLENLGTAIYDGVWVGEDSRVENVRGIRKQLIDRLRDLRASVIRWPGGNFADYYDWQDGIGPRERRPRRTNHWCDFMPEEAAAGPQRYDPNWFGTPEFSDLCRSTGARPFLNVNTRSLPAHSFLRWVEYCNSPSGSTTLAETREADGSATPYGVRYWGIGNEVWAAGGGMSAQEYAAEYKRFATNVPRYGSEPLLIACGAPPGTNTQWVRELLGVCRNTLLHTPAAAISLHYYATMFLNQSTAAKPHRDLAYEAIERQLLDANARTTEDWYRVQTSSIGIENVIAAYWNVLREFDEQHRIKIAIDEWGAIYRNPSLRNPLNLTGRAVTMRDAVSAALTLDIFNRHGDKLLVANFTGLMNQEGGIFQAEGDQFCVTPVYHVFRMYSAHQGATAVRMVLDVPEFDCHTTTHEISSLPHLRGSASLDGRTVTLTVVNPHASEPHEANIALRGGVATSVKIVCLNHEDRHAQNSFDDPNHIVPVEREMTVGRGQFRHLFPPASVTALMIRLA